MMNDGKSCKLYLKNVRALFPLHSRDRKRFLSDLGEAVETYIEQCGDDSYECTAEHFGKPEEVVYDYLSAMDPEDLCKKVSHSNMIRVGTVIFIIAVAVCVGMILYWGYDSYRQTLDTIVVERETIIY